MRDLGAVLDMKLGVSETVTGPEALGVIINPQHWATATLLADCQVVINPEASMVVMHQKASEVVIPQEELEPVRVTV
jgi:hypothetical protein